MNKNEKPAALSDFCYVHEQLVDWGDMDAYGHVSNIRYYNYAQSARIGYVKAWQLPENIYTIIVSTSCQYMSEVRFPDTLLIGVRTTKIGNTSLAQEYAYYSKTQDKIVAQGMSVLVLLDKDTHEKCPVSDAVKQTIAKLDTPAAS